jgi:hypothetical protein
MKKRLIYLIYIFFLDERIDRGEEKEMKFWPVRIQVKGRVSKEPAPEDLY